MNFAKNKGYKIKTKDGWQDFLGVQMMGDKPTITLEFEDKIQVTCTSDHKIFVNNDKKIPAIDLEIGDTVLTSFGNKKLVSVVKNDIEPVFDIVGVENGNRFYADGVLVSNCEPIIFDETLINATRIAELEAKDPIMKQGQVRWFKKPSKGNTYALALDPSLGTGGDNAAIQVFELPSMIQVAEWMHNKTPVTKQVWILAEICKFIADEIGSWTSVYYTVENNSLGEAALVAIEEMGEENIPGVFMSEPKKAGHSRMFRKGFNTTNKVKVSACAKFKNLVETRRMQLNSKNLISEIKNFIGTGVTYQAKPGETDDLVMATILVVRLSQVLQNYDQNINDHLRDSLDDYEEPMPFFVI